MPRRKRRVSGRKGRLEFVASPVHIAHGMVSPVFASDRPCTADVIPIDESITKQWVSPQFREPPTPGRLTRARRGRQRHGSSTNSNISSAAATATTRGKNKPSKVVPLRFLGDNTLPEPSVLEEVTYDEDNIGHNEADIEQNGTTPKQVVKRTRQSRIHDSNSDSDSSRKKRKSKAKQSIDASLNEEITMNEHGFTNKHACKGKTNSNDLKLLDNIYGIAATGAFKRLQEHQEVVLEDGDEVLPDCFTKIKRTKKKEKKKIKKFEFDNADSEITLLGSQFNDKEVEANSVGESSSSRSSPVFGTQNLPIDAIQGKPKKRLFPLADVVTPSPQNRTLQDKTMEQLGETSMTDCPNHINTPELTRIVKHFQPPLSARDPNRPKSLFEENVLKRRSPRLKQLLENTPVRRLKPPKILVEDTPESEYGWTVRQRQLKYWKKGHR